MNRLLKVALVAIAGITIQRNIGWCYDVGTIDGWESNDCVADCQSLSKQYKGWRLVGVEAMSGACTCYMAGAAQSDILVRHITPTIATGSPADPSTAAPTFFYGQAANQPGMQSDGSCDPSYMAHFNYSAIQCGGAGGKYSYSTQLCGCCSSPVAAGDSCHDS